MQKCHTAVGAPSLAGAAPLHPPPLSGDRYVNNSASCGTGTTASGLGSGNRRSPYSSVDRQSSDRRIETPQVAAEGRNRASTELAALRQISARQPRVGSYPCAGMPAVSLTLCSISPSTLAVS